MSSPNHHEHPYGVGLAYRFNVHREAVQHRNEIDLLELSTEDYIVRERRTHADPNERLLRDALASFPCVAHGLRLSIGTVGELDEVYLKGTRRFIEENGLNIFSEHLAYHSVDGNDLTMFLAIPFEEVAVEWVKRNYFAARRAIGRPFALENVTYSFAAPHGSLSEADFLRRVCEETDCTLLLDVTNVFNNSRNHGYDPIEFFDRLPMERVSQMHLAGGHQLSDGRWEDSHSAPVMDEVWPLFDEAVKRSVNVRNVILERDSQLKPFDSVMADIRKAREIFYSYRPVEAPEVSPPVFEEVEIVSPDSKDELFAGMRSFQRALMGRITDSEFRTAFLENAPEAVKKYELSDPEWFQKLIDCDGRLVHEYEEAWDYFKKEDKEVAKEYNNREWAAWANQLGPGGF
ncbi:MAG: DUF692 domain-containing protein [Verrucomicrobiales bacterium]|nr:DUF692 domain-containing protein [Verrucomicrobiales bacterium]